MIPENCNHGYGGEIVGKHDNIYLIVCRKCNQMYFHDTPIFEMFLSDMEKEIYGKLRIDPSLLA